MPTLFVPSLICKTLAVMLRNILAFNLHTDFKTIQAKTILIHFRTVPPFCNSKQTKIIWRILMIPSAIAVNLFNRMFIFCSHNKAHTANNMYKQAGGNILLILRVRSIARLLIHSTLAVIATIPLLGKFLLPITYL